MARAGPAPIRGAARRRSRVNVPSIDSGVKHKRPRSLPAVCVCTESGRYLDVDGTAVNGGMVRTGGAVVVGGGVVVDGGVVVPD